MDSNHLPNLLPRKTRRPTSFLLEGVGLLACRVGPGGWHRVTRHQVKSTCTISVLYKEMFIGLTNWRRILL
jgi:hypothetical protein